MSILNEFEIDGKKVKFMASARTPRLYRTKFGRDLIIDMEGLKESFSKAVLARNIPEDLPEEQKKKLEQEARLKVLDLTIFENLAYIMAKQACPETVPETIDDWLDEFQTFDIYEVLPKLLDMWTANTKTIVKAKKK